MRRVDVFGPLADKSFRRLWLAATTSAVGSAFVPVAPPISHAVEPQFTAS